MKVNRSRLKTLLKEMTDIYSPSGKEEALLRFLCGYLGEQGFSFIRQPVSGNRFNIILRSPGRGGEFLFAGHLDTVSAYDIEEYGFSERRGTVKGLGVADMKGGCAAMIEAFLRYAESAGGAFPATLALVVGEEENSDGMRKLLEEHSFSRAIVGEPTDMRPCTGHYGYAEIELVLSGERRHASLSCVKNNATYSMLRMLPEIISYLDTFEGKVRSNIRDLHSSEAGFAVPERCSAWLDVHVHPNIPIKRIIPRLKGKAVRSIEGLGIRKKALALNSQVHPGYDLSPAWKGFSRIRLALENNGIPWEPSLFESHSDAAYMRPAGIKPVVFGPGRLSRAHTRNESVPFSQVARAAQVYLDVLRRI
ncbi:MAG: M20/M25/M40 family metallo-hydrolase [Candidatus Omnitrophica bacterium]|nr:M20/M25/M40 family metallo-hydrolase [Candidatus Omnitrophota bacterium]